ncbi:MAG: acyltransferase family protein [Eubacteriales bacterium]|nr:acyltransferase family protein [Eubacteriales bacterium]
MPRNSGKKQHIPQHVHHGKVQRDMRIDNVRGFLIILVVIGHFLLPFAEADTRLIDGLIYIIYIFHMPCFVMISGYYAKNVYKGGRFRWGKIVQMIWLYFVYESVIFITEGMAYGFTSRFPDYLHESGAPWYLLSLSIWYMTLPLFQRFRGKKSSVPVTILMFIGVVFLRYFIHMDCLFAMDRTLAFLPFFYLGFFSSQQNLDSYIMSRFKKPVDIIAVITLIIVLCFTKNHLLKYNLVVYGADYKRYSADMYNYIWLMNLIWYALALAVSLGFIGAMLNRRMAIISGLGRNTLQIYFLHRPIRDILMYYGFYERLDPFSRLDVLFLVVFSIILSIVLGAGFISDIFKRLRMVFDPLLEKHGAL